MHTLHASTGVRLGFAIITAFSMSFVILVFMQSLIRGNDDLVLITDPPVPLPAFIREKYEDPYPPLEEIKPPDEPLVAPEEPEFPENGNVDEAINITLAPPPGMHNGPQTKFEVPLINTEVATVVDMQPVYPQRAISRGIEGYVLVEFTVTRSGSTDDIRVLEAMPENVFNRSALRAASKTRFKPKIVNGEPVGVRGIRKKYTFRLDD